jgi:hypothetical protein
LAQNPRTPPSLRTRLERIEREEQVRAGSGAGLANPFENRLAPALIFGLLAFTAITSGPSAGTVAVANVAVPFIVLLSPAMRIVARRRGSPYPPLAPPRPRWAVWLGLWTVTLWSTGVALSLAILIVIGTVRLCRLLFEPVRDFLMRGSDRDRERRAVLVLLALISLTVVVMFVTVAVME